MPVRFTTLCIDGYIFNFIAVLIFLPRPRSVFVLRWRAFLLAFFGPDSYRCHVQFLINLIWMLISFLQPIKVHIVSLSLTNISLQCRIFFSS